MANCSTCTATSSLFQEGSLWWPQEWLEAQIPSEHRCQASQGRWHTQQRHRNSCFMLFYAGLTFHYRSASPACNYRVVQKMSARLYELATVIGVSSHNLAKIFSAILYKKQHRASEAFVPWCTTHWCSPYHSGAPTAVTYRLPHHWLPTTAQRPEVSPGQRRACI